MTKRSTIVGTIIGCAVIIGAAMGVPALGATCDVTLRIFEYKADGTTENYPVTDAKVSLVKAGARKAIAPKISDGVLVATLEDGKTYSIEIRRKGNKTTRDSIGCQFMDGINRPSRIFFVWPGDSKEVMQPRKITPQESGGENRTVGLTPTLREDQWDPTAVSQARPASEVKPEPQRETRDAVRSEPYQGNGQAQVMSGGVVNGAAAQLTKPPYPAAARAVRASGAVLVQVTIDELGNVISATAVSGHPLLRAASEKAAMASKFRTTFLSGYPVMVTGVIVYNFQP